jgi:hypothetical protein
MTRSCEQKCGQNATVYALDRGAGGWGGYYCEPCAEALRFMVVDRLTDPHVNAGTDFTAELIAAQPSRWQRFKAWADRAFTRMAEANADAVREGRWNERSFL